MKNRTLAVVFSAALLVSACGGRTANPVMVQQYGDQSKSCEQLHYEITNTQNEMQRILPKTSKVGKNVALGVAGWFLLVPWFFMDFKNADKQEYEALRQRYNHLTSVAIGKNCEIEKEYYPSVAEMEAEYEKQKAERKKESGVKPGKQHESQTWDDD